MQTIITGDDPSLSQYLGSIWKYRSFILTLAKRDLKVKYAQTVLGLVWSFLQPLTAVVVFTLFFSVLLQMETAYPYALFVLSGVLSWGIFNYIFSHGSTSLTGNQDLIRKLSFPKMVLPLSKVVVATVEFSITLLLMIPLFLWFGVPLSWNILAFPIIIFFIILFALGVALIMAAVTLRHRDLQHIIPFLVNFGIWFTPVFYPVSLIPEEYKNWIFINPMASLIGLFRWSLFGDPISYFALSGIVIAVIFLVIGVLYFRRVEAVISEIV